MDPLNFRIGDFEFDSASGELRSSPSSVGSAEGVASPESEKHVRLPPQPALLLALLFATLTVTTANVDAGTVYTVVSVLAAMSALPKIPVAIFYFS